MKTATAVRKPKPSRTAEPPKPAPVPRAETPRAKRINAADLRGTALKNASGEFESFNQPVDMRPVIGLIDLFRYFNPEGHRVFLDDCSWLGKFLSEVLLEVAAEGPLEVLNEPEKALRYLKQCVHDFEMDLTDARAMVERHENYSGADWIKLDA